MHVEYEREGKQKLRMREEAERNYVLLLWIQKLIVVRGGFDNETRIGV